MKLSKFAARAKKEVVSLRERIVSVREMRLAFDDYRLFWVSGLLFAVFQAALSALLWRVDTPWNIFLHQISLKPDDFLVQRDICPKFWARPGHR